MSNTMTAHEPSLNYLDSILNEEEKRCEYSHQWRNFTISRSGRFKSKNKKRDIVDGKFFDPNDNYNKASSSNASSGISNSNSSASYKDQDKISTHSSASSSKFFQQQATCSTRGVRDKPESYKSYYETNL